MNTADPPDTAVLLFGGRELSRPLTGLPALPAGSDDIDAAIARFARLIVVGGDAELATVLTRLLRAGRLDVEVGYAPRRRTAATRAYRLRAGRRGARRAAGGAAERVPLIRDDAGTALVGAGSWLPAKGERYLRGEGIVDDTVIFDGDAPGVRIEPTAVLPGLRARVISGAGRRRWLPGRAAQLGSTGAVVVRDGVSARRPVRRSTFYRHVEGWLVVR